jgi:hypothetical protein
MFDFVGQTGAGGCLLPSRLNMEGMKIYLFPFVIISI